MRKKNLFILLVLLVPIAMFIPSLVTQMIKWQFQVQRLPRQSQLKVYHTPVVDVTRSPAVPKDKPKVKRTCNVVTYNPLPKADYKCHHLKRVPSPEICVYTNLTADTYVSRSLAQGVPWEADIFKLVERFLKKDSEAGLLDIGANLGQYSLYAAMLGRPVIAVEAYKPTLNILQHSIVRNNLTSSIVLVHNAIAESRRTVVMKTFPSNKGGSYVSDTENSNSDYKVDTIYLDDLVESVTFDRAIMKMDIETYEAKAMSHAEKLLDKVFVAYILMEWAMHKRSVKDLNVHIPHMIRVLTVRSYSPKDMRGRPLDRKQWKKWPNNIVWRHSRAPSFHV